jgi:membrane-associated phospholipid phosphatase
MPHVTARTLSILGHPLVAPPLGLLLPTLHAATPADTLAIATGFAAFALATLLWSVHQVRRGRWAHIDASRIDERRALNRVLLPAILTGTALAWLFSSSPRVVVALAAAAGIVLVAMLAARWCKLSLHVAFAVFAAGLLWPMGWAAMLVAAVLAVAIGWSRLRLSRHAPIDLAAGAAAGTLAAAAVWILVPRMGA